MKKTGWCNNLFTAEVQRHREKGPLMCLQAG
jgi:hypothetical protein